MPYCLQNEVDTSGLLRPLKQAGTAEVAVHTVIWLRALNARRIEAPKQHLS